MPKIVLELRKIFCKHDWNKYWLSYYDDQNLTVEYRCTCTKCGKTKKIVMPIDNVVPAYEHYKKLQKEFRIK